MRSLYPLQCRRVAEERVGEVSVNAALSEDRKERIVDADGRNARESICREVRRKPNIAERRVLVSLNGRIHAVNAETTSPQQGRLDSPVVLNSSILGNGRSDETITQAPIPAEGRGV